MTTLTMERDQDSIQTRKQDFVRGELWKAAVDLFDSAGFDQTTVDQIATRAQVSSRTFFRYFSSKEDVMARSMRSYGEALIHALQSQPEELRPFDAAKAAVKQITRLAIESPASAKVLRISKNSPAARGAQLLQVPFIEDDLAQAFALRIDSKRKSRTLAATLLASLTLSTTSICVTTWLEGDGQNVDTLVDEAFAALEQICSAS